MTYAPSFLRVFFGLFAAVFVTALLHVGVLATSNSNDGSIIASFATSASRIAFYGSPLALGGVLLTELARLRRLSLQAAIGTFNALLVARLSIDGEVLTSPVYSNGALTAVAVLGTGGLASLAYWAIAGRYAGWRGERAEQADALALEAYKTASAKAKAERCIPCLAIWALSSCALFAVLSWAFVGAAGLRDQLLMETTARANEALKASGHAWASFRLDGDQGVVEGLSPDESEAHAAYDDIRTALDPVIGFPGIIARVDNKTVARVSMAAVQQQLVEAARREKEAQSEALAAKEAARAAELDAKRRADEQAAIEAENKRRQGAQAKLDTEASLNKEPHPAEPLSTPAADDSTSNATEAASGADTPSAPASSDPVHPSSDACAPQDVAKIESSQILFDIQQFEVVSGYDSDLDSLAASARACAPRTVQIDGRAATGEDSLFNPSLGFQRAEAVRDALITRGVDPDLVLAKATTGTTADEADANSEQSRIAEFKVLETTATGRDATQTPDERVANCQSDLETIMAKSIIHFATASARVSPESMTLIKGLARAIQTCGSVIITVEGHTDKIGTLEHNQELSEARANTTVEALISAGADPTRLRSRGFAASRPFDPADTAEAFALNRRIEFHVTGKFASASTGEP